MAEQNMDGSNRELVSSPGEREEESDLELEDELHALDANMNTLRQRIFLVQHNIVKTPDPEAELTRLQQEFDQASERFVQVYRRWNTTSENR